ncbi:MAG: FAD-dependent oxidoreductase [Infirmifilum sp.]
MPSRETDFAVLGCGWAGLLLSLRLKEKYPSAKVICIDKDEALGGLLRSELIDGFTFDVGGSHILFSRDQEVLRELLGFLGDNFVKHERKSFILYNGYKVPYPFENGLFVLPPETRAEMLIGFVEALIKNARGDAKVSNLREWAELFFGKTIAQEYLIPYNEKIWKRSAGDIDSDWLYVPGRLPWPDWRDIVKSATGVPTVGYAEQATFYYPLRGGIQSLFNSVLHRALSQGVEVLAGVEVKEVVKGEKWLVNRMVEARHVFSTIPLVDLLKALDPPSDIKRAASQLEHNKVIVVGVALRKAAPQEHWIYVPQRDIIFHRYAWISNYSPLNAPRGSSSLIAEITLEPAAKVDKEKIEEAVVDGLKNIGVLSETGNELRLVRSWAHKYGYPVYTRGHAESRKSILEYLSQLGILSVGRWGSWHYWNMDKVLVEVNKLVNDFYSKSQAY